MRFPLPALALAFVVVLPAARADSVAVRDVPNTSGAWQEARGIIDAPPSVVRSWLLDYARWPSVFDDVKSVRILSREGEATRIRFESKSLSRTMTIRIRPTEAGLVFEGKEGNISFEGKMFLTPASGGRTDVTIQNVARIGGFLGMLAPHGVIKDRQRQKLRADLGDLQKLAKRVYVARP